MQQIRFPEAFRSYFPAIVLLLPTLVFAQAQTNTITLSAAPNPSNYGQPVTLTATVPAGATGRVTFYDGVTILGIATISGTQASLTTVALPSGNRMLHAYYQGDGTFAAGSSATAPQTVVAGKSAGLQTPSSAKAAPAVLGMTVADLNGDYKQDLVVTGQTTVSICLGNGDGTFQTVATYNGWLAAIADFNQDGIPDLVVSVNSVLGIMLGNGDGTFQAARSIPAPLSLPVVVGDFNGDGKPDLAGVAVRNVSTGVLFGNGDGTFQTGPVTNIGTLPTHMVVEDFNGDGKADIAMTTFLNTVGVLLGNGDGTFQVGAAMAQGHLPLGIVARDFNGDGEIDLLVPEQGGDLMMFPGKGDGTFGTPIDTFTDSNSPGIAVEDYDGDGIPDVFVTEYDFHALGLSYSTVLRGLGDGTFNVGPLYSQTGTMAEAGDFNGDGVPDVLLGTGDLFLSPSVLLGGLLPDLTIAVTDSGSFTADQQGADYAIYVKNSGNWATSGAAVQVSAALSGSLSATSMDGTGWTCTVANLTCTRADLLDVNATYSAILLKVNVAGSAAGSVTSTFTVSGGGETNTSNDSFTDTALIRSPSATGLSVAPSASTLSQPVTLTASVTGGGGGTVAFYDGSNLLGTVPLSAGQAVFATSLLPPGSHTLRAAYSGDSGHAPSTSAPSAATVNPVPANGLRVLPGDQVNNPQGLLSGDVNNDGKIDLVSGTTVLLGNGDGTFHAVYSGQLVGASAVMADFDKDGKLDIADLADGIVLLRGNGDGTFSAPVPVSPPAKYASLAVADLNGDGNPDLVALSPLGGLNYFTVELLGNGDGTFQPPQLISSAFNSKVYVADMNGDGKADLVLFPLAVLLGNGDGTFQPPLEVNTSTPGGWGMVVGDFNGDSAPDVALISLQGIYVLPGNGDGTLGPPILTQLSNPQEGVVIAGDFNGDGKLDIAYEAYPGPSIAFAFGNGDGSFQAGPTVPIDPDFSVGLVSADFNRDGETDLASLSPNSTTVDVFLGGQFSGAGIASTHFGGFTAGQTGSYQLTATNSTFTATSGPVTVIDTLPPGLTATAIGGNGWACIPSTLTCTRSGLLKSAASYPAITVTVSVAANLSASVVTNHVSVSMGGIVNSAADPTSILLPTASTLAIAPNPATFGQPVTLTAALPADATGTVLFMDNGIPLGTASVSGGKAILVTGILQAGLRHLTATYTGDGTYGPSRSPETSGMIQALPANGFAPAAIVAPGAERQVMAMGDFNHDGIADLVTANVNGTVSVLLGKGDGTFRPETVYPVGGPPSPGGLTVADFNNDGNPDLAIPVEFFNYIPVLLGNPDGTFQPLIRYLSETQYAASAASDFNGDGKVDLLTFTSISTHLHLGNGDGTFRAAVALPGGDTGEGVPADFRSNSIIDVITSRSLLLGNGDGTFQSSSVPLPFTLWTVAVGDLNGDGKPDLVSWNGTNLCVSLGNGDGTFQVDRPYAATTVIQGPVILLADVDGDGNVDVLVADVYGTALDVLLGNGDGTLRPAYSIPTGGVQSMVAGDFNGDGRTDLALLNKIAGTVTVLLGTFTPTLAIASTHGDPFTLGQSGATYTITVKNASNAPTAGAITVTDTLPAGLTATAISGTGWNCTLASLTCQRSDVLAGGASYDAITLTVDVTAGNVGSGASQVSVSGGGAPTANSSDLTTIAGAPIAIVTNPPGLLFSVDGGPTTTTTAWNPAPGAHTIAVPPTQAGPPGTQYVFDHWSDGGAASHTITVAAAPATYTADFTTQYQLTLLADPQPGGVVTPASGTYFDAGTTITLQAAANPPYVFAGWSGPSSFRLNGPTTVTATFNVPGFTCAITGDSPASAADVQRIVNEALGAVPAQDFLAHGTAITVADVQKLVNAVIGLGCLY